MSTLFRAKVYIASSSARCTVILSQHNSEYYTFFRTSRRKLCTTNCFSSVTFGQIQCAVLKSPKAAEYSLARISNLLRGVNSSSLTENLGFGSKISELLLLSSSREAGLAIACDIFKALILSKESVSSTCYMRFATCFISTRDFSHLLSIVRNLEEELPVSRATVVLNRILFAFGKSRQVETAKLLFSWMKNCTLKPDLVSYNIILEILGSAGKVDVMMNEFESMESFGIVADIISFNTVLNGFRKAGRLDLCLEYYDKMIERGIKPDLLTFTALIASLGRSGNVEDALRLFNDMKGREIPPSMYVYRSLITDLRKVGKIDLASAMQDMLKSDLFNLARPCDFKRKYRNS